MAFCSSCGHKLADNAKFCFECGAKRGEINAPQEEQRKTVYDGELHKCPNCSSMLNAFVTRCDICGYELRGSKASSVVRGFADEIKRLEQAGGKESSNRIATHISTFPVPNTREELMEFLILSSSNISEDRYKEDTSAAKKAISDAWAAKFEQAYQKALLVFAGAPELPQIKQIYDIKQKSVRKSKAKGFWTNPLVWSFSIVAIFLVFGLCMVLTIESLNAKETKRLDAIVDEVYEAIEDQDYVLARARASAVIWNGIEDREKTKQWNGVREQLLDTISDAEEKEKTKKRESIWEQLMGASSESEETDPD